MLSEVVTVERTLEYIRQLNISNWARIVITMVVVLCSDILAADLTPSIINVAVFGK